MTKRILTLAIVGIFSCSVQATVLTYKGGNGTFDLGFEQQSVDFFDDSIDGEGDVHDDQAYGDNVTGSGPDIINSFEYGNRGEGFTPNITVQHKPNSRRQASFGGCYGGSGTHAMCVSVGPVPSPDGIEMPFFAFKGNSDPGMGPIDVVNWVEFTAEAGIQVTMFDMVVAGDRLTNTSAGAIITLRNSSGVDVWNSGGPVEIFQDTQNVVGFGGIDAQTGLGNGVTSLDSFFRLEIDWAPGLTGFVLGDFAADNIRFGQNGTMIEPPTEFTWAQSGLGDWAVNTNWNPVQGPPGGSDDTARFSDTGNITGDTNVSTMVPIAINGLQLTNQSHNFVISGLGRLDLMENTDQTPVLPSVSVAGTHQIQVPVNFHNDADVFVATDSTLTLNNAVDLMGNTVTKTGDGTMEINNNLIGNGGTITSNAGTLSGTGTVSGDLNNNATVAPGNSPGILTIDGNYTQSAGGTLALEIGGMVPGDEHDKLVVTGTATLAGTLDVSLINSFTLAGDMQFDVLDFNSVVNDFTTFNLPTGLVWDVSDGTLCFGTCVGGLTDYDNDGTWSLGDLNLVLFNWNEDGASLPPAWLNSRPGAGTLVGLPELNQVLFNWGQPGSLAAVPEPMSGVLLLTGLLVLVVGRRR
jgi:hypothetical protein